MPPTREGSCPLRAAKIVAMLSGGGSVGYDPRRTNYTRENPWPLYPVAESKKEGSQND